MSPEQIARAPLSGASDQFGLGVMLYELLRGRRPFDGESPLVVMDRIKEAAAPDVRGMDEDVAELVLRCLSRRPEDRFPTTEALARTLFALRRHRPALGPLDVAEWVRARLEQLSRTPRARLDTRPLTP
jgi:serine/threonine-protein kinase